MQGRLGDHRRDAASSQALIRAPHVRLLMLWGFVQVSECRATIAGGPSDPGTKFSKSPVKSQTRTTSSAPLCIPGTQRKFRARVAGVFRRWFAHRVGFAECGDTPRGPPCRSSAAPLSLTLRVRKGGRLGVGCAVFGSRVWLTVRSAFCSFRRFCRMRGQAPRFLAAPQVWWASWRGFGRRGSHRAPS